MGFEWPWSTRAWTHQQAAATGQSQSRLWHPEKCVFLLLRCSRLCLCLCQLWWQCHSMLCSVPEDKIRCWLQRWSQRSTSVRRGNLLPGWQELCHHMSWRTFLPLGLTFSSQALQRCCFHCTCQLSLTNSYLQTSSLPVFKHCLWRHVMIECLWTTVSNSLHKTPRTFIFPKVLKWPVFWAIFVLSPR